MACVVEKVGQHYVVIYGTNPITGRERTPIRFHDIRHTHATLLLCDRVPIKVVSERLGHAAAESVATR